MTNHLTDEQIASLAESRDSEPSTQPERHLARCATCAAAFREAVRWRTAPPSTALSDEMRALALSAGAEDPRDARRGLRLIPLAWAGGLAAAAVLVLVLMQFLGAPSNHDGILLAEGIPPQVQTAIGTASATGMILPGGESWADRDLPSYRSGGGGHSGNLLDELVSGYPNAATFEEAVWAISGYLAEGRIETARAWHSSVQEDYPDDRTVQLLAALLAHRENDLDRSRTILEELVARHAEYRPARLDLAILLRELGRTEEARPHLERIVSDESTDPIGKRAARLLTNPEGQ